MQTNQWAIQVAARLKGMKTESDSLFESIGHNASRGAARELFIKDFLIPFLPPNVGVGTGEIINHRGERSNQIDIVLYNRGRLPPVLLGTGDLGIFPWECVIATIEVKSQLTAEEVRSSILNAYSIRRVVHSLEENYMLVSGKRLLELRSWHFPIPAYIFAFETNLKTHTETEPHTVGPEGERLNEQRTTVSKKFSELFAKLDDARTNDHVERIQAISAELKRYHQPSNADDKVRGTTVDGMDLLGICVLGKEWFHGHILFEDKVYENFSHLPIRTMTNFNYCWESVIGDGSMKETLRFLAHLLQLAHEMPRCFEIYSLNRYLDRL
jgi:hypothetical protein